MKLHDRRQMTMCVIVYKPKGVNMPTYADLKACFSTNKHGAGFMLPINNKVVIKKGFMTFKDLKKSLIDTFKENNLDPITTPLVIHFRITTQGGVKKELCHPFAICKSYNTMRLLKHECDLALAHNGIITLTSTYGLLNHKEPNYNDTMTFIKDYLSLIVENDIYWGMNNNKVQLVEKLIGYSKLAIMNKKGYVNLIGDFYKRGGVYYSNLHAFPHEDLLTQNSKLDQQNL